ncbi:hypothetical protein Sinme_6622 (plasmid) [Sinorhizobium meliloti AK83]|nr:hypothetical protein Sinme_6622 [Sinorhizobium meliloti AK83]SEJ82520.1 hypothetical protein SAMN04244575_06430 [Sinorhizobium meliloti]
MATITHVFTINHVAEMLGENRELLEAIVSNSDNLTYGSIISVVHADDETITALTDDGIDELRQMLADARRSPEACNDFLDWFVDDEEVIASSQGEISTVTIGPLRRRCDHAGSRRRWADDDCHVDGEHDKCGLPSKRPCSGAPLGPRNAAKMGSAQQCASHRPSFFQLRF